MNERHINTDHPGAALINSDRFREIDQILYAGLDAPIHRDQFERDVWFPSIWFGQ
jgi:hypothetical protein